MKKTMVLMFSLAVTAFVMADTWTDPETGYTWRYRVVGDASEIYGYYSYPAYVTAISPSPSGDIIIPPMLGNKPVKRIGNYAFRGCSEINSVTMPNGIISIGESAFAGCYGLTSIVIPDTVTSIGDDAFNGCGISHITIPSNVASIGQGAFYSCSSLKSITVSDGVESIGASAFCYCNPSTITIPKSVTSVGGAVFRGCNELISINVDSENCYYTSVNGLLLSKDEKTLVLGINGKVVIPNSVTNIYASAFIEYCGLTEVIIPSSVVSIGECSFADCRGLKSVVLSEGIEHVGVSAFADCSSLESIDIPDSVETIGDGAFCYCSALKNVIIGKGVLQLGSLAFKECNALDSVTFLCMTPPGLENSDALNNCRSFRCPSPNKGGGEYIAIGGLNKFNGFVGAQPLRSVSVISSSIRETDPTVLDVVFKVISSKPTARVRVLAFEDGERSFAKVLRPETFVDGTAPKNWDAIEANVEHTLSWRVSSDWATRLAKVKFEVLVMDENLVPLELMTIPASDEYGKMKISWNAITAKQWFDALLWLYADHDSGLTLENGVLKNESVQLASGMSLCSSRGSYISGYGYQYSYTAPTYVYSKMGYSVLSGDILNYANQETRLELSPSGTREYAYKMVP